MAVAIEAVASEKVMGTLNKSNRTNPPRRIIVGIVTSIALAPHDVSDFSAMTGKVCFEFLVEHSESENMKNRFDNGHKA